MPFLDPIWAGFWRQSIGYGGQAGVPGVVATIRFALSHASNATIVMAVWLAGVRCRLDHLRWKVSG